jgi:hypothetical protein
MKKLLIATLLLLASNLLAQNKKAYYYDENMKPIRKKVYHKQKYHNRTVNINYETDTAIIYTRVPVENVGFIKPQALAALRKDLETSSGIAIDTNNTIVINFYPGPDPCYLAGTKDKNVLRHYHEKYQIYLKELGQVSQFYVYQEYSGLEIYEGVVEWMPDLNKRVEDNFFIYHYDCGSIVVINPNGKFISFFSEYSIEQVCRYILYLRQ